MENYNKQKWEDLDLSRDEIKSIGEALKKEEFRTLLLDYVKEINDPENRKQYEHEITQLENERGVNVTFIHPSPGYVIKTSSNGKHKAFINICSNANIEKPSSTPSTNGEQKGLRWSIPHCIAPPRDDLDKKNHTCTVYDVVFHPDTLHLSRSNSSFKKLVDETALDAVETNFKVSLDKINLKFPKMEFKGMKHASVIRKKIQNFQPTNIVDIPNYPYTPLKDHNVSQDVSEIKENTSDLSMYSTPKHVITQRNSFDMQHFTNDTMSKISATIPNELVVVIDLPLLKRSTDVSLDVSEKTLSLISESPAKYKLKLNLPYTVNSDNGSAKFDTDKKTLTVTLPVLKSRSMDVKESDVGNNDSGMSKDDSGIDSDNLNNERSRMSGSSSSDDDSLEKEKMKNQHSGFLPSTQMFLKPNVHYSLPPFECFLPSSDVLKLNLTVPNVEPESVEYKSSTKEGMSGFHMTFLSTGNGFFTQYFSICFLLPPKTNIEYNTLSAEVWDSKVCIQAKLSQGYGDTSEKCFFVGVDESKVKRTDFSNNTIRDSTSLEVSVDQEKVFNGEKGQRLKDCEEKKRACNDKENNNESSDHIENSSHEKKDQLDTEATYLDKVEPGNHKLATANRHSSLTLSGESGSSFDDESSSSPRQSSKTRTVSESHRGSILKQRGILKIGRSLSESSADDYASWSSDKAEKSKKTVRFSDVISRQTFRLNSSILGQRKKNQKKTKNKKRAQERRLSESGNESEGDNDVFQSKERSSHIWVEETDTSSCDVSEVSDISESDDGQPKDDSKTYMPCSSRKNHRRRGKKSARKQAATAKIQFFDH